MLRINTNTTLKIKTFPFVFLVSTGVPTLAFLTTHGVVMQPTLEKIQIFINNFLLKIISGHSVMEHTWQSVLEIQMQIWKWVLEIRVDRNHVFPPGNDLFQDKNMILN